MIPLVQLVELGLDCIYETSFCADDERLHGWKGVPKNHYEKLEYRARLENDADELLKYAGISNTKHHL